MAPLIECIDLYKTYGHGEIMVNALDDINMDIGEGEFVALMGPSGSGKSTLLHIIAGIDRPSSGVCKIAGIDIATLNESDLAQWRNQYVGFIFQTFNLLPVLTAYENVELPLLLTKLSSREREEHVRTALDLVELSDRADHYPRQLSGGQEQRVAIARAIVTDPSLILADEPTGDLDAHSAEEVMQVLTLLNKHMKKTIVMVTHDPRSAHYASLVRHLDKGFLVPLP
jgi:putative ABC transport system ATP-binding protein